ncbi:MAG: glycosyltransferase [Terracidiphilus sp.]
MERTKLLLLTPRLGGGGAQQVMALLARSLSQDRFEVHLGLVRAGDPGSGVMPDWVTVHPFGAGRARAAALTLLQLVWRVHPGVILAGSPEIGFLTLFLRPFFPRKTRVLVRQNSTVSAVLSRGGAPWYTRLLYRFLYPRADRIVCQSRAMGEDLEREIGIQAEKIVVLPNPVDLEGILAACETPYAWSGPGPHLLAAGRLAPEKGFDLLIEALGRVRERFPDADLTIAGTGGEKASLQALCCAMNLENAVHFADCVQTPYGFFPGATLFVLSSRYEGMPNVLLEAAAACLPLVATPASGGVVDLLHGRRGAWLAAQVSADALADALLQALKSIRPGERVRHEFFVSMDGLNTGAAAHEESEA